MPLVKKNPRDEQTRDPPISYRKIIWNPLISLGKILAFFSAEMMGSPNILLVWDERVWNPVICVKNVGAGAGNEHMDI